MEFYFLCLHTLGGGHAHTWSFHIRNGRINLGWREVVRWVGTQGTGQALGRDVILMLGRSLVNLGSVSSVGERMGSVLGAESTGEWLRHW